MLKCDIAVHTKSLSCLATHSTSSIRKHTAFWTVGIALKICAKLTQALGLTAVAQSALPRIPVPSADTHCYAGTDENATDVSEVSGWISYSAGVLDPYQ